MPNGQNDTQGGDDRPRVIPYGPGNTDELTQAENLVPAFCKMYPGLMKELIMDRGYISGPFVGKLKRELGVDVLIPLRASMSDFEDALKLAQEAKWVTTENEVDPSSGKMLRKTTTACIEQMELWDTCPIPLDAYVSETRRWSNSILFGVKACVASLFSR